MNFSRLTLALVIALLMMAMPALAQDADEIELESYTTDDGAITVDIPADWMVDYVTGGNLTVRNTEAISLEGSFPAVEPGQYGMQILGFPPEFVSLFGASDDGSPPSAVQFITNLTADSDEQATFSEVETLDAGDDRDIAGVTVTYEGGGGVIVGELTDEGAFLVFGIVNPEEFAFMNDLSVRILNTLSIDFEALQAASQGGQDESAAIETEDADTDDGGMESDDMIAGFMVEGVTETAEGIGTLTMLAPAGWDVQIDLQSGLVELRSTPEISRDLTDAEFGTEDYIVVLEIVFEPEDAPDLSAQLQARLLDEPDGVAASGDIQTGTEGNVVFSAVSTGAVAGVYAYALLENGELIQASGFAATENADTIESLVLDLLPTITFEAADE